MTISQVAPTTNPSRDPRGKASRKTHNVTPRLGVVPLGQAYEEVTPVPLSDLNGDLARSVALVAEDDEETRNVMAAVLRGAGFAVELAGDGEELVERTNDLAGMGGLDVLVCELSMPKLDGLHALRQIRDAHRGLPIVVVSAHAEVDEIRRAARRLGARRIVSKPFDLIELRRTVEELLE